MQKLNQEKLSYLTQVKKEINELCITKKYKIALIRRVENLFDPKQLVKDIDIDEINTKLIIAERDLVFTRFFADENDTLFANPSLIEDDILCFYRAFISK